MFDFAQPRRKRTPSLTPMIDVVFLLLVFFMLASRFGIDMEIPLNLAGQGAERAYSGPPRLVDITPEGVRLNGQTTDPERLASQIEALTESPEDTIVLRSKDGAEVQAVVAVMQSLSEAGFSRLVLVE